ncbi:MAG: hypothetical protein A3B99_02560 [Candidatus Yanofskybacteria bacterium RIFCSPHIGHO2_02_FULL_44_12b]|uniref:Uncharacterized protein n=1 Tax=Candidatus Yanofskybacteria bacterium RIFCSPLOWO2_01_FULL_44_22 TaxID=1802697 RepID=A0A1F8GKP1_9BACT|nr:MAG: hypothetical protein A2659_00180 [Candidatus Yanofskybacteria bacterium RIFCSPHIGHO2_01_FULL_44_24]OGN15349.1 MAG: hypothetical protein A3B99_02560 [Candidatus Yanofskybacteria bacterium RIFCSPHIGHO2_02_FULL_44_12b]OGN25974.1 MAG: hypothetical protein A2925_04560 [Candidatus Yanofskybacteria bacterium RIFCSPLOWO2_01_FULL_44_22]
MINWQFFIVFLITVLSLGGLAMIAVNFDPYRVGLLIKALFFASFLMSMLGMVLTAFMALRIISRRNNNG